MLTISQNCMKMKNIGEWRGFEASPLPHESENNRFEICVNRVYLCLGVTVWHLCDGSEARHITDEQCHIHNSLHMSPGSYIIVRLSWLLLLILTKWQNQDIYVWPVLVQIKGMWENFGWFLPSQYIYTNKGPEVEGICPLRITKLWIKTQLQTWL